MHVERGLPTKLWSTVWPDEDLTPGGGDPGWLGDVFALWFALPILAMALLPIALLVRSTDWAYRRLTGRPGMAEGGRVVEALGVTKDEKLSGEARALVDATACLDLEPSSKESPTENDLL